MLHHPIFFKENPCCTWITRFPLLQATTVKQGTVLESQVSPAFAITYFCNHCNIRFENTSKYVDTVTLFFKSLSHRSLTPRWPLTPSLLRSNVTLPKDNNCVQVPQKYIKVCGYSDPFFKNLNQRSLTPRWPLTPCLLRSHVWLYTKIIVSKVHENTSMYVNTLINFAKYHIHT